MGRGAQCPAGNGVPKGLEAVSQKATQWSEAVFVFRKQFRSTEFITVFRNSLVLLIGKVF